MRFVFLLMLIISTGLAWLGFSQPQPALERKPVVNLPRVHELQLVSEVGTTAGAPLDAASAAESPPPEKPGARHEAVGPEGGEPDVPVEAFSLPDMAEVLKAALGSVSGQSAVGEGAANEPGAAVCLEVTGFVRRAQAEAWLSDLDNPVLETGEVGIRKVQGKPLHWVIIPPQPDRGAALTLLRDLQRAGVDSYLVAKGEQRNAISLGLFESRRAAERILQRRRQSGLDAHLTEFRRSRDEVVVRLMTRVPARVSAALPEQMAVSPETDGCKALQR